MGTTATARSSGRDILSAGREILAKIGRAFDLYVEALSRSEEVRRLDGMTDEELARIGIRRDEIVRHVFRDKIHAS